MNLNIRAAARQDVPQLIELCAEHARYERAEFAADEVRSDRLCHALFAAHPRASAWVAVDGATLLGYASAAGEFSTWSAREYLHVDCLFVREGARGRGIGVMLLGAVIEAARAQGFFELQWQTPDWNERTIRFYERFSTQGNAKRRFTLLLR